MGRVAMAVAVLAAAVWMTGDEGAVADEGRAYRPARSVTAEGTAAMTVRAETVRLEFVLGSRANAAEAAIAGLKQARDRFAAAVASSLGTTPEIKFGQVKAVRPEKNGEASSLCWATQTATFRLGDLPKDDGNVDLYLQKLAAAVYDSGAAAPGAEGPLAVYEALLSDEVQERLLRDAIADAKRRASAFAKALGKGSDEVEGGYVPRSLSVNGRRFELDGSEVVEGDTLWMRLKCSVDVALAQ